MRYVCKHGRRERVGITILKIDILTLTFQQKNTFFLVMELVAPLFGKNPLFPPMEKVLATPMNVKWMQSASN